jgi:hypothetical protein
LVADVGCERDVLADGEVREEDRTLGSVGEIAEMGGDAVVARLQLLPTCGDAAGEGYVGERNEAAGGAEDGAFAASGRAEEDGPRRREGEVCGDVQRA